MATKITLNELRSIVKHIIKEENILNEDILELKQMSKQLYSFLKNKGFIPQLKNQLQTGKPIKVGEGENAVQIVVTDKPDERVIVGITANSVAKAMVGGGDDWNNKATQKFGPNFTSNAITAKGDWFRNPEIMKYVDNLGNEILKQIFDKYPNMEYGFRQIDSFWYVLEFRFKTTKKGGEVNPNQRLNTPNPQAQPLVSETKKTLRDVVKEILKEALNKDIRQFGQDLGKYL
jgi:hypothetical protein